MKKLFLALAALSLSAPVLAMGGTSDNTISRADIDAMNASFACAKAARATDANAVKSATAWSLFRADYTKASAAVKANNARDFGGYYSGFKLRLRSLGYTC